MPNWKPGDHPLTDILVHKLRVYGAEIALAAFMVAPFVVVLAIWGYDVWGDRRHTVVVRTETPVFVGSGEGCDGTRMTTASPNTVFRVKRIRYWMDCATIDLVLSDGRKGHILLGEGEVSITPRLP
jgi:hypothetical protein